MDARRQTLPVLSLLQPRGDYRLPRERMGRLLDVSAKTIARWEQGDRSPVNGRVPAQLARLREIADLGRTVYTPDGFAQFLAAPLPAFAGRTALQLIEAGEADRVLAALAADYEGLGY